MSSLVVVESVVVSQSSTIIISCRRSSSSSRRSVIGLHRLVVGLLSSCRLVCHPWLSVYGRPSSVVHCASSVAVRGCPSVVRRLVIHMWSSVVGLRSSSSRSRSVVYLPRLVVISRRSSSSSRSSSIVVDRRRASSVVVAGQSLVVGYRLVGQLSSVVVARITPHSQRHPTCKQQT